ncbi:YwbE family protein [Antarcticibacterium arcticum]|uniref:YwbE family protein n=1 Tax=Antarcticibacterium arcticum TaxID=2585771 RepID=A0A5B8YLT1_9FLAO|nr:YwbE family protein [Antarcticibacterium arcticum]QED38675.1 YwbE family protein [Antarcticibacterium arcticum]
MIPTRKEIAPGTTVLIIQKHYQRSGTLTEGVVATILTKSPIHPHGIKVRLETGEVGRVQKVVSMLA